MKMRKISLLICSLSILVFSCKSAEEPLELTLMTYNIYHGEHPYQRGKSNLEDIAAIINEYKPDFVALQEVDSMTRRTAGLIGDERKDLVQELARLTNMNGYFGKSINFDEGGYGNGLLSRVPLQAKVRELPLPNQGGEARSLIYTRYEYSPGKELIFAGTHLCHAFPENREAQAERLNALLLKEQLPVILAGDLNLTDTSAAYNVLDKQWLDAAEVHGNPENTFSFTEKDIRIDYVLLNNQARWEVHEVEVVPVGHSDHMPLIVKLRLNP